MPRPVVSGCILSFILVMVAGCMSPTVGSSPTGGNGAASKKSKPKAAAGDDDDDDEPKQRTSSAQKAPTGPTTSTPTPAPEGAACSAKIPCGSGLVCGASARCERVQPLTTAPPPTTTQSSQACTKLGNCCGRMRDTVDRLTCAATATAGNETVCDVQLVVCLSGGLDLGGVLGGTGSSSGSSGGLDLGGILGGFGTGSSSGSSGDDEPQG